MTRKILTLSAIVLAMTVVSCSGKKKKPEDQKTTVTGEKVSFSALGSDSGEINGLATVNFEYDRATLSAETKRILEGNASWIKSNSSVSLQIEGHCDSRGSVEYNLALGERRAQAVKNYLVSQGVSGQRLTIISYGKEKPVALGDSEGDHTRNRRANFVPLPN